MGVIDHTMGAAATKEAQRTIKERLRLETGKTWIILDINHATVGQYQRGTLRSDQFKITPQSSTVQQATASPQGGRIALE